MRMFKWKLGGSGAKWRYLNGVVEVSAWRQDCGSGGCWRCRGVVQWWLVCPYRVSLAIWLVVVQVLVCV